MATRRSARRACNDPMVVFDSKELVVKEEPVHISIVRSDPHAKKPRLDLDCNGVDADATDASVGEAKNEAHLVPNGHGNNNNDDEANPPSTDTTTPATTAATPPSSTSPSSTATQVSTSTTVPSSSSESCFTTNTTTTSTTTTTSSPATTSAETSVSTRGSLSATGASGRPRLSYQEEIRLKREARQRPMHVPLPDLLTTKDAEIKHWLTTSVQARLNELFHYRPKEDPESLDDIVFNLKKDLERHKRRINALEKIIASKEKNEDEYQHQLTDVPEPRLDKSLDLVLTEGYRIVDLKLLRFALQEAQKCDCASKGGTLNVLELSPSHAQEDLATQLALVCNQCHNATIFANSAFSRQHFSFHHGTRAQNYVINRKFLSLLGTRAYFQLVQTVQEGGNSPVHLKRHPLLPSELILSVEKSSEQWDEHNTQAGTHGVFDDESPVEYPSAELNHSSIPLSSANSTATLRLASAQPIPPEQLRLTSNVRIPNVASSSSVSAAHGTGMLPPRLPAVPTPQMPLPRLPVPPMPLPTMSLPTMPLQTLPQHSQPASCGMPSSSTSTAAPSGIRQPRKIKATPELPAGSRISILPTGSPIVGRVIYSTVDRTGLDPGSYRVAREGDPTKILIVTRNQSGVVKVSTANGTQTAKIVKFSSRNATTLLNPDNVNIATLPPRSLPAGSRLLEMVLTNQTPTVQQQQPHQAQPLQLPQATQPQSQPPVESGLSASLQTAPSNVTKRPKLLVQDVRGNVTDDNDLIPCSANENLAGTDDYNEVEPLPDISSFLHLELGGDGDSSMDVNDALNMASIPDPLLQPAQEPLNRSDVIHLDDDDDDDDDPNDADWGAKKSSKKNKIGGTQKKKVFTQF